MWTPSIDEISTRRTTKRHSACCTTYVENRWPRRKSISINFTRTRNFSADVFPAGAIHIFVATIQASYSISYFSSFRDFQQAGTNTICSLFRRSAVSQHVKNVNLCCSHGRNYRRISFSFDYLIGMNRDSISRLIALQETIHYRSEASLCGGVVTKSAR